MKRHSRTIIYLITILILFSTAGIAATLVVNTSGDSHDAVPGDGICDDGSSPDSVRCTLRAAFEEAEALAGIDTITSTGDSIVAALFLGTLRLEFGPTVITGVNGYPIVDGLNNPPYTNNLEIASDSNTISGLTVRRARHHGVYITGKGNVIGGESAVDRNILAGNGQGSGESFAIAIDGKGARGNTVRGNFIGMFGNGTEVFGNAGGVLMSNGASENRIGGATETNGNLISGNLGYGIVITSGATGNVVDGNIIGPDITLADGPGNAAGGVLLEEGASANTIGSTADSSGNLISLNGGNGVTIRGSATSENSVRGNLIGVDGGGTYSRQNSGSGVLLTEGAHDNTIGGMTDAARNIISGNLEDGVRLAGQTTRSNTIIGNYLGPSRYGGWLRGYPDFNINGVGVVDGAHDNVIGGRLVEERNVISGNITSGVYLAGAGTSRNRVIGNFIGVSRYGISSAPNGSGVIIRHGAHANVIGGKEAGEGNLISGNRLEDYPFAGGVVIYDPGSDNNVVQGNFIGTDIDGVRALRNGTAGVIIGNGAQYNLIGGDTPEAGNVISGNGDGLMVSALARGVYIYGEGTDRNIVSGNVIGLSADSDQVLPNLGNGVGIFEGARHTLVGGTTPEAGNVIAANYANGVVVADTLSQFNTIRYNSIYINDSLGIAIRTGAQEGIQPPHIVSATTWEVRGNGAPALGIADVYVAARDSLGVLQPMRFAGSHQADSAGSFVVLVAGVDVEDSVTVIATDAEGNSSAFSAMMKATQPTGLDENEPELPASFALEQNYPNPFNPSTLIRYSIPRRAFVQLTVYNLLGEEVITLESGVRTAGEHSVVWDGRDRSGEPVASGVYLYRLTAEGQAATRKMLLLK